MSALRPFPVCIHTTIPLHKHMSASFLTRRTVRVTIRTQLPYRMLHLSIIYVNTSCQAEKGLHNRLKSQKNLLFFTGMQHKLCVQTQNLVMRNCFELK